MVQTEYEGGQHDFQKFCKNSGYGCFACNDMRFGAGGQY